MAIKSIKEYQLEKDTDDKSTSVKVTEQYAEKIFNELLAFQGYGFCKSHATAYSVYSAVQLWLQEHYFIEYMAVLLTHVDRAKEKKGVGMLDERVQYCIAHGLSIHYPDVNISGNRWTIRGSGLIAPLSNIKGFSEKDTEIIEQNRPYSNIKEFMDKTGFSKGKFESLLFANALLSFGDVETIYNWYYNEYTKSGKKKQANLFLDFGDSFTEKEEENRVFFTKDELKERCYEMNGFFVDENLMSKYPEIYSAGMEPFIDGVKDKIYSLQEAIQSKAKEHWVFVIVKSIQRNIRSKHGGVYDKIELTDGINSISIFSNNSPIEIQNGNKVIIPLLIDRESDKISLSTRLKEKYGVFLVEKKD